MDRRNKQAVMTVPPRWLQCPRKSLSLIGGKFLAFKTPLSEDYDTDVPEECRFYPPMLLASLGSYKVKMGIWIDLTYTSRFYDKAQIESLGIKYLKLQCRGHGECPNEEQTRTFVQLCSNFVSKNPLDIIGVHCTHGFNRTGFLICAYLVEHLSWSVEAAIGAFANSRPPGIYKEDYLKELFRRYGDVTDCPPPPVLPDWCAEFDDSVDDDGNSLNHSSDKHDGAHPKRRKEFNKKNPVFMEGVPGVTVITTQPKCAQIQRKCQAMSGWTSNGFPGCQPVSMDMQNISLLQHKNYKVSWKADGTRYMMLIDGENEVYFIDRDNSIFQVANVRFPRRKEPHKHIVDTLLDGEMVLDKTGGASIPRFLVYDIIRFEGQEVGKTDFGRRMLCINKEIIGPRTDAKRDGRIDGSRESFSIRAKEFFDLTMADRLLSEQFTRQLGHEVDGLIFQPAEEKYVSGQCMEVLKWKPASMNSVDFILKIRREHREGMLPENKGYLFVGQMDSQFAEIKVNKTLKELDNKIIECKYEKGQWVFMRERTDKSFPNSYKTALAVCQSIKEPVTKEKLLDLINHRRWRPPVTGGFREPIPPATAKREAPPRDLESSPTKKSKPLTAVTQGWK